MLKVSVVIPVLNEADIIQKTLIQFNNEPDIEVIVVDGGSQDKTIQLVQELGIKVILSAQSGRANQMNVGAGIARGDILLFLHADSQLPYGYPQIITASLSQPETIAGAFELAIDAQSYSLRLIERIVNWRSHFLDLPYGDQGIFLKASIFQEVGGFKNIPIMEDFELIQRLKKIGRITIVSKRIITSGRRWQKLGVLKTTIINQLIIIGYYLGISPTKLANFYRQKY